MIIIWSPGAFSNQGGDSTCIVYEQTGESQIYSINIGVISSFQNQLHFNWFEIN